MSWVHVYKVHLDGSVQMERKLRYAPGGALYIWTQLSRKYCQSHWIDFKPLWAMWNTPAMNHYDKIVLGLTFDGAIIEKQALVECYQAMMQIFCGRGSETFFDIARAIKELADDEDCMGVCFDHTSVAESFWSVPIDGGDDCRPYNVNVDQGHWYLFETLSKQCSSGSRKEEPHAE